MIGSYKPRNIIFASELIIFLFIIMASTSSNQSYSRAFQSPKTRSLESLTEGESLLRAMVAWKCNFSTWVGGDPCQWDVQTVRCNDDQKVVYLNLSKKGVQGPIPLEIGNLRYLQVLDLNNPRNAKPPLNQVTGDLSALQSLTSLYSLNLSFNNVKLSSFPTTIFSLKELIHLRLDNNYISGQLPMELASLTNLEYLYLGNNSMKGPLPKEFSNLTNLRELSLWNNDLNSKIPPEFGKLSKLEYINLHDCQLYGGLPQEIGNITSMKNISLYGNSLTGPIPESWKNLIHLYNLWLYENYLTKSFPTWIKHMPALTNVSLDWNYFYGSLPDFKDSTVKIVTIDCNFFSGSYPSTVPSVFNDSGNCFNNYDSNSKISCRQRAYFDCNSFQQVANGACPDCPQGQVIEDAETCVCTLGECPVCPQGQVIEDSETCVCTSGGGGVSKTKAALISVGTCLLLIALIWLMWARCRRRPSQSTSGHQRRYFEAQGPINELWEGPDGIIRYKLQDLARETNDFNSRHEIGMGGFGKVFHAVLDGRDVAVKRAHLSSIQSSEGFCNEVLLLSRLHHKNLVRLLGFCEEDGIQILVYEYMPNGNLDSLLFKSDIELDWLKRLDIAIAIAQGLEYLHSFADPPVIHRDVKPSNILLDDNLVAKLSDFGLSKVARDSETHFVTRPAGTLGYIDPQYILKEQLTTASDVYSFGIVLLEVISGQKAIDITRRNESNLVDWVKLKLGTDGLKGIIDPRLGNIFPFDIYRDILRVAIDCASFRSEERPSMKAVLTILDACRWSVSPHLVDISSNRPAYESEEDVHASDQQRLVQYTEHSVGAGTSTTFDVSCILPR